MKFEDVATIVKKQFDDDLKRQIAPLSIVKEFAPLDTLDDLKELMVAAAFYGYRQGYKEGNKK